MLKAVGVTDIGLYRESNQDAFFIRKLSDDVALLVLCDGMGGVNGGNVASETAVQRISGQLSRGYREELGDLSVRALAVSAVSVANAIIRDKARKDTSLEGMGTTVEAVIVRDDTVYIAHVGDSSVFLLTENGMEKLTTDHTRVQQLLSMGEITPAEALNHPQRHWLTRAVGVENNVNPDFLTASLEKGEALLLCSDGLTNEVELSEIRRILWEALSRGAVQEGAEALVEEAKRLGGADNITVVVVQRV